MKNLLIIIPILFSCTVNNGKQTSKKQLESANEFCLYLNKPVKELTLKLKLETADTLPIRSYIRLVSGMMLVLKNKDIVEIYPKFQKNDPLFEQLKANKVDYSLIENLSIRKIRYSSKGEIVEECGE